MKVNKFIYPWEKQTVFLKRSELLTRQEIADRLGLTFNQVKYILSKPNVKHYDQTVVLPVLWKQEIDELEKKLAEPITAYVSHLVECTEAQKYQWVAPAKKVYYSDNAKRLQVLKKIGRTFGITGDQKTKQRDLEKAIFKHTAKLEERLQLLRSELVQVQNPN